jgi:hypothetical protein
MLKEGQARQRRGVGPKAAFDKSSETLLRQAI